MSDLSHKFEATICRDKDVVALDVTVRNLIHMEVVETRGELNEDVLQVFFAEMRRVLDLGSYLLEKVTKSCIFNLMGE